MDTDTHIGVVGMPGRAGFQKFEKEQVLEAIDGSGGIVSAVAQRLGCDWNTAKKYIERWKETRAAFDAERERVLDLAETTLVRSIRDGDVGAAKWYLSRLGRHRGYGDAVDVTSGGEPLRIVLTWREGEEEADDGDD